MSRRSVKANDNAASINDLARSVNLGSTRTAQRQCDNVSGRRNVTRGRKPRRKRLLWTVSPANGGLVFAEAARARFVARIWNAIRSSDTWAEFRQRMPRQGYSDLIQRGYIDVYRRKSSDPFPEHLREELGEGEHPYPPWLQKEMDKVLPPDILERFEDTDGFWPCQDPYTHIDPEHKDEIIALLEQRGFTVEDGRDLDFY